MVKTKNPAYWDNLSKKGKVDGEISIEIENLLKGYAKTNPESIFNKDSTITLFSFTDIYPRT